MSLWVDFRDNKFGERYRLIDLRGKSALVTGASAGIGEAIARVLAREVGTLVLVARRRERLDAIAADLKKDRANLRVIVRACDLVHRAATAVMFDALEKDGVVIDILINNAGFGDRGLFEGADWKKIESLLELNVVSATFVLRRLLPGMVARRFGAVLNVGSTAGIVPSPESATYAASKAYLNHLNEAVRAELSGTGVSLTALLPGPVPTEFQAVAGGMLRPAIPRPFWVDAATCAEEAIRALKRGDARVVPGLAPRLAALAVEATPKAFLRPLLARVGRGLRNRKKQ
ncbi:MAG: SDR family oxidoreductase [Deltaproteobacteria bacterium]|nr:SDR family oxidoreductase [Deltaproteobacteria bacterium]